MEPEKPIPRITNWITEHFRESIRELEEKDVPKRDIIRSMVDALREMRADDGGEAA